MIEPTAALPLHFTLETLVLSAAGLFIAWAVVRRRWPAAAAGVVLAVVEGLHAGQFIGREDEPVLVALRLTSIAVIAALVVPTDRRRLLLGGGLGAIAVGTIWGAFVGGGAEALAIAPHLLMFAGGIALVMWVWLETRPSVRLRVLAAFISVLAVAVVVAGGAVARVAAVDARNDRYATLGLEATTMLRNVIAMREDVMRRAATLSSEFAVATSTGSPKIARSIVLADEWIVITDEGGKTLASATAEGADPLASDIRFGSLAVFTRAAGGAVTYATRVDGDVLQIIAAAPIYQPGSSNTPADVIGVILVGQTQDAAGIRDLGADPSIDVAVIDTTGSAGTDDRLTQAARDQPPVGEIELKSIDGPNGAWLATVSPIPGGSARLVVAATDDDVVDAATDLVRAFLVAILAAALLAVVAALWLSSRITRPMLQLADDAERVKSDFLASVSHELRTPLTPIRGYTEILRSRAVPARDASGYLDEIGLAAQRLERVVALLVDVASIEAGRFRVMVEAVSPVDLFNETVERWRERSGRRIDVRTPRSLPDVMADAAAISRVLDELIDNAIKFAPEGEVEIRARRVGDSVEMSVRDDGPGIDPERLKAVREAFTQEESGDTRRFGGLGLGLTFIEGVLDAHGAKLDITSTPGAGTTCAFALAATGSVGRMPPKAQMRKR